MQDLVNNLIVLNSEDFCDTVFGIVNSKAEEIVKITKNVE